MKELGIQKPGVAGSLVSGASGHYHHIIATGFLPTNGDGSPRIEMRKSGSSLSSKNEMPLDAVDSIVINLRKGINLGV